MEQDAVLDVPANRAREHNLFEVPAFFHQILKRIAMGDARDALLDNRAIIEQGVARISHRDAPEDLVEKGRDVEKVVLSRAVRWHIENRILLYRNKTIIFE